MLVVQTMFVMRQNVDDATVGNRALRALSDHARHFLPERLQSLDPTFDIHEMVLGDGIDFPTGSVWLIGQRQKLADRADLKAQLPGMPNKSKPAQIGSIERPPVVGRA